MRQEHQKLIDEEMIIAAISTGCLTNELNLETLFPRQQKFASKAVEIILELSMHGPQHQTALGKTVDLHPYEMTRLLEDLSPYVIQRQNGKAKIVVLADNAGGP